MEGLIYWLIDNKEWIFSGIGVFLIGIIFSFFFSKRKINGDKITTHGKQSPGKVNGNYTINEGKKED